MSLFVDNNFAFCKSPFSKIIELHNTQKRIQTPVKHDWKPLTVFASLYFGVWQGSEYASGISLLSLHIKQYIDWTKRVDKYKKSTIPSNSPQWFLTQWSFHSDHFNVKATNFWSIIIKWHWSFIILIVLFPYCSLDTYLSRGHVGESLIKF